MVLIKSKTKRTLALITALAFFAVSLCGCGSKKKVISVDEVKTVATESKIQTSTVDTASPFENIGFDGSSNEADFGITADEGTPYAAFLLKDRGYFVVRLLPDVAPKTVEKFLSLVKSGYFDGNYITDSMYGHSVRGGDRTGKGKESGASLTLDTAPENGRLAGNAGENGAFSVWCAYENGGEVGFQFTVMIGNDSSYNGAYCQIGEVVYGMDVLRKLNNDSFDNVESEESSKLKNNVVIEKAVVDYNE